MPTREEILAELERRKSASAPVRTTPAGLSPDAIRAELARRAALQAAAPKINRPSMGFDPVGEAARGMQKPMMDAVGAAVLGRPLPTQPPPPMDPLAPKGGWSPGQQQQQKARVADPGNPFNPRNAGRPDSVPAAPDFGALAERAGKSIGGMIGGQRPESEALAQFGGSVVTDPVGAANTAIEVLDPIHQFAYAYNDADAALKAGVSGDFERAGNELKDLSTSGSFAAMSFLPGAEFAGAPGRAARAAGSVAPKAAGTIASAAPEAVAAQVAPKPQQPMFTGPPGPAPSKGNFIVRRADQIIGGAVGATVGGTGDALAAPGDGSGDEGGLPTGALGGAAIGIFGPRALANASSRGFRAAARTFGGPTARASFDERVAAKAVREALRSAGIRSADDAAAQMAARYGDKPAAVADLTQEGVGTAAGLSRLPGRTGEAAKARSADLLQNRSGRLFTDIESTTGIDPANVTKTIDDDIRQASQEISPAYEEMFAASRGVNSERLMELMDDPVVAPYLRRAAQASESLATTAGQVPSNARTWDLVKRALDRKIEGEMRASGQAAPELMSARQAVRDELDALIPEYKSIRDNADAPRMRAARKEGANAMGGRLSVEKVKKVATGLTGRPLTTMQAGMIEQLVPNIEKGRGIEALSSGRTEQALAAAFGEDIARDLVARVRADAALTQNASRINPNVGSVTSQANMGGGGVGGMIAGAVRAVRNPTEAGLSWLSKSGAYSKQQRDIMGEMLLEGTTPENLQRIFRGRGGPPSPRPQGPPSASGSGNSVANAAAAPAASAAPPPPADRGPIVKNGLFPSKQPLPMDEAGGKNYIDQAVEHFGVTDDLREAGYLLPDGRMLDLSGRHDMLGGDYVRQDGRNVATGRDWQAGVRHTDHRELPFDVQEAKANEANFGNTSTAHMLGFQKETGAIRIMPGTGISVSVMPSDKQIKALVTRWRRTYGNDPMLIDVDDAVTGKNLTSIDVQRVTVEDVKNALRQAPSPPSQSGSSKLLAGVSGLGGVGLISAAATTPKDETKKPRR